MCVRFIGSATTVLLTAAVLMACGAGDDSPVLTVVVDTNYGVDLQAVVATIPGPSDSVRSEHRFETSEHAWPLSFGVVPTGGEGSIALLFNALGTQGQLSERRVEVEFESDRPMAVPVFLDANCRDVACPSNETCTESGCQSPTVSAFAAEPGRELEGLCRPGEAWCDPDGSTFYECDQFGVPPTVTACANGCEPGASSCADGVPPGGATVTVSVGANGRVVSAPAGIDCGSTCSAVFAAGRRVWLQAVPDAGYSVDEWSASCESEAMRSDVCELRADGNVSASVTFEAR